VQIEHFVLDLFFPAENFANSVPVGLPAVLFIGVRDNGEIETPQKDLEKAQQRFATIMQGFCNPCNPSPQPFLKT
jgi:hypothetical protein